MWTVQRVFLLVLVLLSLTRGSGSAAEIERAAAITGTVTDASGNALEGVKVSAKSSAMGSMLWWPFEPATTSGADGRFTLSVPFPDIAYRISVREKGFADATTQIIPDQMDEVRLQLRPLNRSKSISGVVICSDGQSVAGVDVRLIGEYGYRCSARTDEFGNFTWAPLPSFIGQGVPLAQWEGLVSPIRIARSGDAGVTLYLVPPARLTGVCREDGTLEPIPGATVIARPDFASDFRLRSTSKADGTFEIDSVPPGEYLVTAVSPTHFIRPPRGYDYDLPERDLRSGETTSVILDMQPMATVEGRVLSQENEPVPGALVCIRSTWLGDHRDQNVFVEADRDGRYSIKTGHLGTWLQMEAFSSQYGLARTSVEDLTAGEVRGHIDLTLAGSTRISGIVTDPEGMPLKDILWFMEYPVSVWATTGSSGTFDFGRLSFHPGKRGPIHVTFRAPRVRDNLARTYGYDSKEIPVESRESAPRFFLHRKVEIAPDSEDAVHLDVVLQPTDLLEIAGTVLDVSGDPIPAAQVHLITGEASPETWLNTVRPVSRWGRSRVSIHRATLLDSTKTDQAGRFRVWTVRENGEAMPMGSRDTDWSSYCIGVEFPTGENTLLKGIVVPEGEERREVTITPDSKESAR